MQTSFNNAPNDKRRKNVIFSGSDGSELKQEGKNAVSSE
jgi:hypothetical protein